MKSSISRRLPTMLEHRIWARMLHGRLGVIFHHATKGLGTGNVTPYPDVSSGWADRRKSAKSGNGSYHASGLLPYHSPREVPR